jgi:hypothetical protein
MCKVDVENKFSINIQYPTDAADKYLRPEILLEIGPLASWLPFKNYKISSFVAECFPSIFTELQYNVKAIIPERTFWEK